MKTTMTGLYLTAALCLFITTAYAESSAGGAPASVTGNYKCQWIDASNHSTPYSLVLSKTGDTYTSEWDDSTGNAVMYGTGVMNAAMSNFMSSTYWNAADTSKTGILSLTIKSDGSLQGSWLSQSGKDTGTETCTKS